LLAKELPARSFTPLVPPVMVAVYVVCAARLELGCRVALLVAASYVTVAATRLPPCFFLTVKVELVIVAGFKASLKLATTVVIGETLLLLLVGIVLVTLGATASTVQLWLAGVESTLPAASVARTVKVCAPLMRPV